MRRRYLAATLGLFLVTLGLSVGRAQEPPGADRAHRVAHPLAEIDRIIRGYQIAPVSLNLQGKDPALVGLGSYIVNAQGGCNDCHTAPPYAEGGDPFLGQPKVINVARYLAGGVPFGPPGDPNTPVSRNLTPRANGEPRLTWPQFLEIMRTGRDIRNRTPHVPSAEHDLLQVMPWPVFQDMTDRDLRAIYEYLRAIPSLPSTP